MTVEYNSNFPLESTLANMGGSYHWTSYYDRLYGCALGVHVLIAQECGYTIVDVILKLDVVLVRNDLLKHTKVHPIEHWRPFTNVNIHFPFRNQDVSKYMCDYEIYMKTHDFQECSGVAVKNQMERLNINLYKVW